jgi:hypothetical protein
MTEELTVTKKWGSPLVAASVLLAVAFCLFANTFGHGWTFDDFPVIVENPDIRSIAGFLKNSYPGRPLREITFLLDHALFGLAPAGWHIQNIFWHGLNAFLLFVLIRRLQGSRAAAWTASLLFLAHPIVVETVANISHRKDSLVLAFSLLSVLAYMEAFRGQERPFLWLAGAFVLAFVAYQGKQTAVALLPVFAAYELAYVPLSRRVLLKYKVLCFLALAAGAAAVMAWYGFYGGEALHAEKMRSILSLKANYFADPIPAVYYSMVLKSWAFMFLKLVFPFALAVEYTYAVPASWLDPWVMGALAGIALYGGSLWFFVRRKPLVFFALVWMGAFWLPVSNMWPLAYLAADRYLYAPSVGFFIVVALLLCRAAPKPLLWGGLVLALTAALAVLTWQQNRVWSSPESLWMQAYKVSPRSSFALNNMGNVNLLKGDKGAAFEYYAEAARVNPINPTAQYNLGWLYEQRGDREAALEHYRRFLALDEPMYRDQARELRQRLLWQYGARFD